MKLLGVVPPSAIVEPLRKLHANLCLSGVNPPMTTIFEDERGEWRGVLAGLSLRERRQSVLVARDPQALAMAVRWSVGGAVLLPASTSTLKAAFEAADVASKRVRWIAAPEVISAVFEEPDAVVVKLVRGDLWQALVGQRRSLEALAALAFALKKPALIASGSSLVLCGVEAESVQCAWTALPGHPVWSRDLGIDVISADSGLRSFAVAELKKPRGAWPVAELPSGTKVGRWSFAEKESARDVEFVCDEEGFWYQLRPDRGHQRVYEVVSAKELDGVRGKLVRLAGFVVPDIDRPGSPGSVLTSDLVREARRRGRKLWLPGVDGSTLTTVLRLGTSVLVDGAVVPAS